MSPSVAKFAAPAYMLNAGGNSIAHEFDGAHIKCGEFRDAVRCVRVLYPSTKTGELNLS